MSGSTASKTSTGGLFASTPSAAPAPAQAAPAPAPAHHNALDDLLGDSDSDVEQIASKYETGGENADTDAKQHE